jgi:hypothetical protein
MKRSSFRQLALLLSLVCPLSLSAQDKIEKDQYGEREVERTPHPRDKDDTWTLSFRFKDPRIIEVDIPAVGKRKVWYMWYQVYNLTGEPRQLVPQFEFLSYDKSATFIDQVLPSVQDEIIKIEDPQDKLKIKNSVTIGQKLIPITRADSYPRTVTGVAIWPTIATDAPGTTRFSIFISGLSDGYFEDENKVIRRKTLQLNYRRSTDGRGLDTSDLSLNADQKYSWIYRSSSMKRKEGEAPKTEEKDKALLILPTKR